MAVYETERASSMTYTATGSSAPRETREIEGLLETSRRLVEIGQKALARTTDMKHRLLGLVEPATPGAKDGPKPVPCELTELRQNLQTIDHIFDRLHDNITTLERI